jgi:aquaporin Z
MTKENMPANRKDSPREPGTAESPAAGDIAGHRLDPTAVGAAFPRTHHVLQLEFGNRADFDDPRREWRRLFSELLGTFALVLAAAGGGILHAKGQISLAAAVVAPGLTVIAVILFMGAISGAHLNPAVSLAFALRGDFPWKRVPGYIIIQLIGATLACLFLRWIFGNVAHLGATLPGAGYKNWQALLMEIVLTALLISVILGTASAAQNVGAIAALGVGGYIALAGLWAAPVSGVSMNPARSFGPALASGYFTSYWVYVAGPLAGALMAVGFAMVLRGRGGDVISRAAGSGVLGPGVLAAKAKLSEQIDAGKVAPESTGDTGDAGRGHAPGPRLQLVCPDRPAGRHAPRPGLVRHRSGVNVINLSTHG